MCVCGGGGHCDPLNRKLREYPVYSFSQKVFSRLLNHGLSGKGFEEGQTLHQNDINPNPTVWGPFGPRIWFFACHTLIGYAIQLKLYEFVYVTLLYNLKQS